MKKDLKWLIALSSSVKHSYSWGITLGSQTIALALNRLNRHGSLP